MHWMKAYLPLLASYLSLLLFLIALVGCNAAESVATPTAAATNVVAIPSTTAEMETEIATAEPATPDLMTPTPVATPTPATEPVEPSATPSPAPEIELQVGQWSKLVYHAGLQQVLLVNGGPETGKPPDDPLELWSWDGARWSLLSADPDGPRWRNFGGVAYDTQRDVLVLVGGLQGRGRRLNDTWEWDGRDWVLRSEAEPVGREGAGIAYDAGRGRVVLFGGSNGRAILQDTWEWDGESWAQVSNEGPTPRFPAAMVYDETQGRIILYGGHSPTEDNFATNTGDIWAWDGSRWEELAAVEPYPGIRSATALVYEQTKARWLLFGGANDEFYNDTWSWDGRTWTELEVAGPPPRSGHSMVYDEARQRVVLFGGVGRPGGEPLTDMWEWDGETWACVAGCS